MSGAAQGREIEKVGAGDTVRLATGITPDDLAVEHSECWQYGDALVAMYGAMYGSVAAVQFADAPRRKSPRGMVAAIRWRSCWMSFLRLDGMYMTKKRKVLAKSCAWQVRSKE